MIAPKFEERVARVASEQAKVYEQAFLRYEYLLCSKAFALQDYYIISSHADNYRHLVGVSITCSTDGFFEKCLNGTLTESDFGFNKKGRSEKEIKGSVRDKIIALPNFLAMMSQPLLAQENFTKNHVHCVFATTDSSATVGFVASDRSRPMTLMSGDRLNPSSSATVDLILRRPVGHTYFNEIVIGDEEMLQKYMDKIEDVIADDLKPELQMEPVLLL